jgi:DNA-binding NtrC family response regulator
MRRVLIVDDDKAVLEMVERALQKEGYEIRSFSEPTDAIKCIAVFNPDVIVSDIRMDEADGFTVLRAAKEVNPEINIIFMTAFATVDTAVDALRCGAFDYLIKPFKIQDLRLTVKRALSEKKISSQDSESSSSYKKIIGSSVQIQEINALIGRVSQVDSTVLICGESGTGKELVARSIHALSDRNKESFVSINCAALPGSLLESELFGYEKGSFTGALNTKIGLVEYADHGSLFLDEIGEITPAVQVKLLRALQEREIKRVGGVRDIPVDVRVIAATSRNLEEEVKKGNFREDLFYRLNIILIELPPLRMRKDDIQELVSYFTMQCNAKMKKACIFLADAIELFCEYDWPGNIRELENTIERIVTLSDEVSIDKARVELLWGKQASQKAAHSLYGYPAPFRIERETLIHVLKETGGKKTEAAKRLNISKQNLQYYLKKFNLK